MNQFHRFWEDVKKEAEKIAALSMRDKLDYFLSYYLRWCLLFLFALVCLFFFLLDIKDSKKELVLSGVMVNAAISPEGISFLTEDYLAQTGESPDSRIYAGQEYIFTEGAEDILDQYRKIMALSAQVAAGEVDYLLLDASALQALSGSGIFCDMGEFLEEEDLLSVQKLLLPVTEQEKEEEEGQEGERKIGEDMTEEKQENIRVLSLKGTVFARTFSLAPSDAYLAFTCLPDRYEKGAVLFHYLKDAQMLGQEEQDDSH